MNDFHFTSSYLNNHLYHHRHYANMMKVHFIEGGGFSGNIFLIDCEKPVMIDTGWDASLTHIGPQIKEVLNGRQLDRIILTHRHVDHIGGALVIQAEFGGTIYAQKDEAKALRTGDPETTGGRMFGTKVHPMEVEDLEDGDEIDIGEGQTLKIIQTPGHTEGGICLISKDDDLFSGDTVFTEGGVGRWDLPTGDYPALLRSIEGLAKLPIQGLYPGHGMPVKENGAKHIGMSLRYLREFGGHV